MESALTYVEIYLYTDGMRRLHSRLAGAESLEEVLEETQGKRFDILIIWNRCVVGTGSYDYTDKSIVTGYEEGACAGFLDRYFRGEAHIELSRHMSA